MNYLVFDHAEVTDGIADVRGSRADELTALHELKAGLQISAIIYNHKLCRADITVCEPGKLSARLDGFYDSPVKNNLHLIVGICRPQTVKKVISAGFVLGARRIDFVRAANSEKSYLSANILKEQELRLELMLAMAQCGDAIAPQIKIFDRFKPYAEDELKSLLSEFPPESRFLADIKGELGLTASGSAIIALGPESGWNDFEKDAFKAQGFQALSLGVRQLRVEQALTYSVGKVLKI